MNSFAIVFFILLEFIVLGTSRDANLTCYQCVKTQNEECTPQDLKPCNTSHDRCVSVFSKSAKNGFLLKRECGLGPCSFGDDMINKGLGLDKCDRSRDEYFCIVCCRENGCNKSAAGVIKAFAISVVVLVPMLLKMLQ